MSTAISLRWNKNNQKKMWTEINKKYLTLFFWKKLSHNFCFHYCLQIVSQGIVGLGSDVPFCQDCVRICTTLILTINNKGWGRVRVQSHSFGSHSSWPPGSSIHGNSPGKDTGVVATPFSRALPDPGIKPVSLASPALAGGFLTIMPAGRPQST